MFKNAMKFSVIGNLTKDIIITKDQKKINFGGTATYCSITASRLGWETNVLSKGNSKLNQWVKSLNNEKVNVDLQQSEHVTHFINDYSEGERKQNVLSDAGKIDHKDIKEAWV